MNIKEALMWASRELKENNVAEPEKSANFLLRQVLDFSQEELIVASEKELGMAEKRKYQKFLRRRKKHEPVWYITGKIEFYGLDLFVNNNVLIPRPETELLAERAVREIKNKFYGRSINILDIGTGSGAIILALASKLIQISDSKDQSFRSRDTQTAQKEFNFFASDISGSALRVALKNAKNLNFEDIIFKKGSLFDPWKKKKFNIIVANLPYIPHADLSSLALDIHHWEPRVALDGGENGIEIYDKLFRDIGDHLDQDFLVICEIGENQGILLEEIVTKYLPRVSVKTVKDYSGEDRILIIKNKK